MAEGPLTPADSKDVAQAIYYALRFGLAGKPHGKKIRDDAEWMASHIAQHLLRANYVILQGPQAASSSTGRWWGDHPGHNEG
jgi:hypothetical protein